MALLTALTCAPRHLSDGCSKLDILEQPMDFCFLFISWSIPINSHCLEARALAVPIKFNSLQDASFKTSARTPGGCWESLLWLIRNMLGFLGLEGLNDGNRELLLEALYHFAAQANTRELLVTISSFSP